MDIHLGHVVTPQDATSTNISPSTPDLLDIPDAAVVVDGSIIAAVGEASDILDAYSSTTAATVHDHGDALIIPGLVDCHVHYPQIGMIASPGEQLLDWLDRYTFPAEARFADKAHAEATAEFFTDQLIRNGVTTALVFSTVHPHSVDALFTAAQRKDLRIITGKMCMDRNAPADLLDTPESAVADSKALIDRWHGTGRLEYAITPRFAPTSSDAQLRALGELAADHPDVLIQTHLSENTAECDWVRELFPQASDYTDVYDRAGLVRERAVFGHAVHLSDRELTRLDEAHASLAHCPTSNNFLGSGLFPLKDILGKVPDLRIGFGSDVGAGTSLSPLATAGEAYKVSRLLASAASTSGTTALTAAELLYHSTLGGARALGVDAHVGSLAPGKDADLVILDPTAATTASGTPADPVLAHRAAQCTTTGELLFACLMLGDDRTVAGVVVNGTLVGDPGCGDGYDGAMTTFTLADFNDAPAADVTPELETIFGSAPLAVSVAEARPFTSVDALVEAASSLLAAQPESEILAAVNAHPPIGGTVSAGSRSAAEQSGATESADLDAVRELQPAYREHFGWNFLIKAAGRSSAEIRAELERRLTVDPAEEWPFSISQLDAINGLRLRGTVND